jgi:hypothetical protein
MSTMTVFSSLFTRNELTGPRLRGMTDGVTLLIGVSIFYNTSKAYPEPFRVNSAPMGPVTGYELYVIRKKGMLWGYFFFV